MAMVLITVCPTMQQHSLVGHCQVLQCHALYFSWSVNVRSCIFRRPVSNRPFEEVCDVLRIVAAISVKSR